MNETSLAVAPDMNLALDPEVKKNLQSFEDYVSYYTTLMGVANSVSWVRADVLLDLLQKHGEASLNQFALTVGESPSTVVNYIRTARAFPPEKRIAHLSFSHHFQASFADSYNELEGGFSGDNRFTWIEQASDNNLSTRKLQAEIQEAKRHEEPNAQTPTCRYCKNLAPGALTYVLYAPNSGQRATKMELHPECFEEILELIEENRV